MIQELGAELCTEFNEAVTHLVCEKIVRNEKLLSAIAKGVTIVDVEYVTESYKASRWLEVSFLGAYIMMHLFLLGN